MSDVLWSRRGVALALASDAAFVGMGIVIASASSIGALSIGAVRIVGAFPILLFFLMLAAPAEARALLRLRGKELCVSLVTATLLGANIWLFGAAPLWGEADGVAQGYLLLPVCLVALDVRSGEALSKPVLCGVLLATLGIAHTLLSAPRLSWVAPFIAASYTLYFHLHKKRGLSLLQRLVSDFGFLTPFACGALAIYGAGGAIKAHWAEATALAGLTALGHVCYLGASKSLSYTVFGMLSLLEPAGLAVIAVVLYHKQVSTADLTLMIFGAVLASTSPPISPHRLSGRERSARQAPRRRCRS